MKSRIIILLFFCFPFLVSTNEIEWEKVEGADFYEIEVINSLGES